MDHKIHSHCHYPGGFSFSHVNYRKGFMTMAESVPLHVSVTIQPLLLNIFPLEVKHYSLLLQHRHLIANSHPAIHSQDLPINPATTITAQIRNCFCNLLWLTDSLERIQRGNIVDKLLWFAI